jgi:hypothetical protein
MAAFCCDDVLWKATPKQAHRMRAVDAEFIA